MSDQPSVWALLRQALMTLYFYRALFALVSVWALLFATYFVSG